MNYKTQSAGYSKHTGESAKVRVQNIQHGKWQYVWYITIKII